MQTKRDKHYFRAAAYVRFEARESGEKLKPDEFEKRVVARADAVRRAAGARRNK